MSEWKDMFGEGSDSEEEQDRKEETEEAIVNSPFVIHQVVGIGGRRGVFASEDLPAGTLVMAEYPLLVWSGCFSESSVLKKVVEEVCQSENMHRVTKHLHPFVLEDADSEEIAVMKELWGEETLALSAANVVTGQSKCISEDEILRVSLVLQHNAYGSGFYEMFSLVNHSCLPNCTKFCPTTDKGWKRASELWTTRHVSRGEELTICYNHKREMTSQSVSRFLHEHHRFQCTCPAHNNVTRNSSRFTAWVNEIQDKVEYYESQCDDKSNSTNGVVLNDDIIFAVEEMLNEIRSSEFTQSFATMNVLAGAYLTVTEGQLIKPYIKSEALIGENERDVMYMIIRLHKVANSIGRTLIERIGKTEKSFEKRSSSSFLIKMASATMKYLVHTLELIPYQIYCFENSHPELAQSYLDVAEGVSCALTITAEANANAAGSGGGCGVNIFGEMMKLNPSKYAWALSNTCARQMMKLVRVEGLKIANLYKSHYNVVQEKLISKQIEMPNMYK